MMNRFNLHVKESPDTQILTAGSIATD